MIDTQTLLTWIHSHGYVDADNIARYLRSTIKNTYNRLSRLKKASMLTFEKHWVDKPGVYRLTRKAVRMIPTELSYLANVSAAYMDHNTRLVGLSLDLLERHNGVFKTERLLRRERLMSGGKGHVPDGALFVQDDCYAIELELSHKNAKRRLDILRYYLKDFTFDSLWYFCGNELIFREIKRHQMDYPFLKCFLLDEVYGEA